LKAPIVQDPPGGFEETPERRRMGPELRAKTYTKYAAV
jgi:hypothetical protein